MIGLAVVLAGGLSLPASAQGLSTERLVEFCRDPSSAIWREVGQLVCPSYIRGLIDGARLQAIQTAGSIEDHRAQLRFCMPESASAADAIAVVLRYVEGPPESRREPAAATVYVALAAAWPCNP
jgi:hypothetical protein